MDATASGTWERDEEKGIEEKNRKEKEGNCGAPEPIRRRCGSNPLRCAARQKDAWREGGGDTFREDSSPTTGAQDEMLSDADAL